MRMDNNEQYPNVVLRTGMHSSFGESARVRGFSTKCHFKCSCRSISGTCGQFLICVDVYSYRHNFEYDFCIFFISQKHFNFYSFQLIVSPQSKMSWLFAKALIQDVFS